MVYASREDKGLTREACECYANYKIEILKTSPDFWPFVDYKKYSTPEMPMEEGNKCISSVIPPMDLQCVKEVVLEYV